MRDVGLQKFVASETALGRVGVPDDIGGGVAMLLAPETRWLTGQRLEVTGGFKLWVSVVSSTGATRKRFAGASAPVPKGRKNPLRPSFQGD